MDTAKKQFTTIDDYISMFPDDVRATLEKLRQVIREAAPDAEETISYQMPTFKYYGNLVHFAVFKNHIGLYPTAAGVEAFQAELSDYVTSKGAIQFPKDKPLPFDLVTRIVHYRVQENLQKRKNKQG